MAETKIALLPNRGVVAVTGTDAEKLLQGIITNDMGLLGSAPAIHAGLLNPQGKILFEFFVISTDDGYLLETSRDQTTALVQRLNLYRLRAKADVADVSANYTVAAFWDGDPAVLPRQEHSIIFPDPRLAEMGFRVLVMMSSDWVVGASGATPATQDAYHGHRIELGVPEGGLDYPLGDTFPHEALFDQLNGVSFTKGCFVGQEVVSRMEHRATARKRVVPVVSSDTLPARGTEVRAGEASIGVLGSTAGHRGLALLRLDRAAEMQVKGGPLMADNARLSIELPKWAKFTMPSAAAS